MLQPLFDMYNAKVTFCVPILVAPTLLRQLTTENMTQLSVTQAELPSEIEPQPWHHHSSKGGNGWIICVG